MAVAVTSGAILMCSMGMGQSSLQVTSQFKVFIDSKQSATIKDVNPIINILPFGMCSSMANPTVASATAAAMGVLTPMPCIPAISSLWLCPKTPLVCNFPALSSDGKLICSYGGQISIVFPGQVKVMY